MRKQGRNTMEGRRYLIGNVSGTVTLVPSNPRHVGLPLTPLDLEPSATAGLPGAGYGSSPLALVPIIGSRCCY